MLVVKRKQSEIIKVGHDIEVIVVSVRGDATKIGVQAPREIEVHRGEVYEKIYGQQADNDGSLPRHGGRLIVSGDIERVLMALAGVNTIHESGGKVTLVFGTEISAIHAAGILKVSGYDVEREKDAA